MSVNPLVKGLIERFADAQWLSEQLGFEARATSLRIKPDTSITAGIISADGVHGWARVLWPDGARKAKKLHRMAESRGLAVRTTALGGELLFQHGEVASDPKLMDILAGAGVDGSGTVLRYNPGRRLVLATGAPAGLEQAALGTPDGAEPLGTAVRQQSGEQPASVFRLTVGKNPVSLAFYRALEQHVAVPRRLDSGDNPHVSELAFVGPGTDLLQVPGNAQLARGAGELFAHLHVSTEFLPQQQMASLSGRAVNPAVQAAAHIELFDIVEPAIAERLRALLATMEPLMAEFFRQQLVLVHGDASPDQVLLGAAEQPGELPLWLTDLDRMHRAPAAMDVGSYLAVATADDGEAFLDGYRSAARSLTNRSANRPAHNLTNRPTPSSASHSQPTAGLPTNRHIRLATAFSHIARLAGPLRSADPNWREPTHQTLNTIEQLIRTAQETTP